MGKFLAALGLATALSVAAALPLATQSKAAMSYGGQSVADLQHQIAPVEKAQFFFWADHNWCWYPFGWRGPGWYWCDYEWDSGYGWGGPYGWNGWYVAPYYRSGAGWWQYHNHHRHHDHDRRWQGTGTGQPPQLWTVPGNRPKGLSMGPRYYPLKGSWVNAGNGPRMPVMGARTNNFAPKLGGYAPNMMSGHPNGRLLCRKPPC